ncbi:MAG TPA: hypothetical protein ENI46_03190, partial [Firmicutes bacterium]|nr:hypothetical protein [Bacillota bacterium]
MRLFGLILTVSVLVVSLQASASEMVFTLTFDSSTLGYQEQYLEGRAYLLPDLENLDHISTPGHPALPVKSLNIYVPKGKQIKDVSAEVTESVTLPGTYRIMPAQPEVPLDGSIRQAIAEPDPSIYDSATPYPASLLEKAPSGAIAGRKIASFKVYPLQYVPTEGKLILNRGITVRVTLEDETMPPEIPLETQQVRKLRNRLVAGLVENPEDVERDFPIEAAPLQASEGAEYLIICLANHADEYELLKNWKTRKGIPTEIAIQESVLANYPGRDEPEQIRNCIKDYYLNRSTNWVLLTLSAPKARIRGCYGRVSGTVDTFIPCDLYFADMDGDWNADGDSYWGETSDDVDLYPDVYVGRMTANTGVQCSTVVHKVLTYEGYYSLPTD